MPIENVPRKLIRRLEGRDAFPLIALASLQELRAYLDGIEAEALLRAREMGASAEDIGEALGITRQGAYYKLKQLEQAGKTERPRPVDEIGITLPDAESPSADRPGRRSRTPPGHP